MTVMNKMQMCAIMRKFTIFAMHTVQNLAQKGLSAQGAKDKKRTSVLVESLCGCCAQLNTPPSGDSTNPPWCFSQTRQ